MTTAAGIGAHTMHGAPAHALGRVYTDQAESAELASSGGTKLGRPTIPALLYRAPWGGPQPRIYTTVARPQHPSTYQHLFLPPQLPLRLSKILFTRNQYLSSSFRGTHLLTKRATGVRSRFNGPFLLEHD